MKLEPIKQNGYDERRGFSNIIYANEDEKRENEREMNKLARYAMHRRLRAKLNRPYLSDFLIKTTIPQTFNRFLTKSSHKACALGAIHIGAGGSFKDNEINWWRVNQVFNVYEDEWDRRVDCPKCDFIKTRNSLGSIVHHLNDYHKASNKEIGKWLKKYHL